jgi:hypothetical protein
MPSFLGSERLNSGGRSRARAPISGAPLGSRSTSSAIRLARIRAESSPPRLEPGTSVPPPSAGRAGAPPGSAYRDQRAEAFAGSLTCTVSAARTSRSSRGSPFLQGQRARVVSVANSESEPRMLGRPPAWIRPQRRRPGEVRGFDARRQTGSNAISASADSSACISASDPTVTRIAEGAPNASSDRTSTPLPASLAAAAGPSPMSA